MGTDNDDNGTTTLSVNSRQTTPSPRNRNCLKSAEPVRGLMQDSVGGKDETHV